MPVNATRTESINYRLGCVVSSLSAIHFCDRYLIQVPSARFVAHCCYINHVTQLSSKLFLVSY